MLEEGGAVAVLEPLEDFANTVKWNRHKDKAAGVWVDDSR
jgi:hypothetical protein